MVVSAYNLWIYFMHGDLKAEADYGDRIMNPEKSKQKVTFKPI